VQLLGVVRERLPIGEQLRRVLGQLLFSGGDVRGIHLVLVAKFGEHPVTANLP
jgi:hypothetical protein